MPGSWSLACPASTVAAPMQDRHVVVVSAGVHDPGLLTPFHIAFAVDLNGQIDLLGDRQTVHVRAQRHDWPGLAALENADHGRGRAGHADLHFDAERSQVVGDELRGAGFLHAEFGMLMQVAPPGDHRLQHRLDAPLSISSYGRRGLRQCRSGSNQNDDESQRASSAGLFRHARSLSRDELQPSPGPDLSPRAPARTVRPYNSVMDIAGTYTFDAPPERVWALLMDPAVISSCIPGCDSFEPDGENRYRVRLQVAMAAITGTYDGTVTLADRCRRRHTVSWPKARGGRGS